MIKIIFLTAILFLVVPVVYAETAQEYYARSGNAVVVKSGGGFVPTYAPGQSKGKPEEVTLAEPKGLFVVSQSAEKYNQQGMVNAKKGDFAGAILDFNRAIEIQPKYPQAFHNRGQAYFAQGNLNQAISEYNQAVELDPNFASVYYDRALAYNGLKDYPQVIADCTKVIKLGAGFGGVYALRGYTYNIMREYDKALADLLQAKARAEKISPDFIRELKVLVQNKKEAAP